MCGMKALDVKNETLNGTLNKRLSDKPAKYERRTNGFVARIVDNDQFSLPVWSNRDRVLKRSCVF